MSLKSLTVAGIVGGVALGAIVGGAAVRLPSGASAAVPPVPVARASNPSDIDHGRSILAQSMSTSTAQAAGQPNPGDDPRLDAWRIWFRSPNKGTQGPYTFWQVMSMKESFGPGFAAPGNATDERDSNGHLIRVIWDTVDSALP